MDNFSIFDFSLMGCFNHPKIVINLSRTYKKLHCKGDTYRQTQTSCYFYSFFSTFWHQSYICKLITINVRLLFIILASLFWILILFILYFLSMNFALYLIKFHDNSIINIFFFYSILQYFFSIYSVD